MNGGIRNSGIRHLPFLLSNQWWFSVTGTVSGAPLLLPVGNQLVEGLGVEHRAGQDMRADLAALFEHADRDFAAVSAASCLRRIAAVSPAGPAPTITTSYCIDSRSLIRSSRSRRFAPRRSLATTDS